MTVLEKIGEPAMLEQTAEECVELAQACLKLSRKLRGENYTPKSMEIIKENLNEEVADVKLCFEYLADKLDYEKIEDYMNYKRKRTIERLNLEGENG